MVDAAARHIGCAVIPAGVGQTEQQLELITNFKPDAYVGTPSFLRILIEKAKELGADISALKQALVAAEALPSSLRQWFHDQGIQTVLQWYGTADLGLIAYESPACEGMILDEDLILEIVRPGSDEPVPDGEVGEVVITSFNQHYPMIRFGTGDLSAVMPGISPCGRTNIRIRGWLGRADQTTKAQVPMALFLIEQGANPNDDGAGFTPLHWASGVWEGEQANPVVGFSDPMSGIPDRKGKMDLIKSLISHKADVNAKITKNPPGFAGGYLKSKGGATPACRWCRAARATSVSCTATPR